MPNIETNETKTQEEFGLFSGPDLLTNAPPKNAIIDGILYENDIVCISAEAGLGKSILALQMSCSLTTQRAFLDTYEVNRVCNVLYVQTEGDRGETVERIRNMSKAVPINVNNFYHLNLPGLCINVTDGMTAFLKMIAETKVHYDVVIFDPLYTTIKGSFNNDDTATDWHREIRRIRGQYPKVAIVVMHHDAKDQVINGQTIERGLKDVFGSSFWIAAFNQNYKLKKHDEVYTLALGKGRAGPDKTARQVEMRLIQPSPLMYTIDPVRLNDTTLKIETIFRGNPDKRYRRVELEGLVDKSKPTVWRALRDLEREGKITKVIDEGATYYKLS